jgi:hypothetical protein
MGQYQLAQELIALSSSSSWDKAKLEWALQEIYEADEPETCLCGKFPIIEVCILRNRINGKRATVGNCCVKKFIGLPSDKIFQAVKRVRKDSTKSLNAEAISLARERGWLNQWEHDFYFSIMRKRSLTPKQDQKKVEINEKIARQMQRPAPRKDYPRLAAPLARRH